MAQTSAAPLMIEIERASGIYMYGTGGQRYMDLISGISVSNVDAVVVDNLNMPALLGMSFLNRMDMRREGQIMTLTLRN